VKVVRNGLLFFFQALDPLYEGAQLACGYGL